MEEVDPKSHRNVPSAVPQIILNDEDQSVNSFNAYSLYTYHSIENQYNAKDEESIHSSRSNSVVSYEINEEPPKKPTKSFMNWIDSIYELFQETEDNAKTDQGLDDNISYEESQVRIIILGSILAFSLALIATTIFGLLIAKPGPTQKIVLHYEPPLPKVNSRSPHVALLFSDNGLLNVYKFNESNLLEEQWSFKAQKVDKNGQYFGFSEDGAIQVIYGDMRKVNSVIMGQSSHKTIANRNILRKDVFSKAGYFRVGNYLWVFGGHNHPKEDVVQNSVSVQVSGIQTKRFIEKTMLWQIHKQRWIWGPDMPSDFINRDWCKLAGEIADNVPGNGFETGSSGVSLSQTLGAIFFFNQEDCLAVLVFDFSKSNWTKKDQCLYQFHYKFRIDDILVTKATSYFNKQAELRIILWYIYRDGHFNNKQIGLLDFNSRMKDIHSYLLDDMHDITVGTLFSSRGMVYLMTGIDQSTELKLNIWKNGTMEPIQTMHTGVETSNAPYSPYDQDFMTSLTFIH